MVFQLGEKGNYLVLREQKQFNQRVLRFIDYLGDPETIGLIGHQLLKFVIEGGYEYLDCYAVSSFAEHLKKLGFLEKTEEMIVPDYFSPFEQSNIDLNYFSSLDQPFFFKGEGDQDRYNGVR